MAKLELLNPQTHGGLRLRAHEMSPHFVQIVAPEFTSAAVCCPIFLTKEEATGGFYAGAMFGFKPGENLVGTVEERGGFQPLALQREGFFISDQNIAIDREHARFSEGEGDPLFDDSQQPANSLRAIQKVLGQLHFGIEQTGAFVAALLEAKLIEPMDISLAFEGGERVALRGLYTVSMDRLRDLDDATALRLFRAGHLQLAYVMAASLKHVSRLARIRNQIK